MKHYIYPILDIIKVGDDRIEEADIILFIPISERLSTDEIRETFPELVDFDIAVFETGHGPKNFQSDSDIDNQSGILSKDLSSFPIRIEKSLNFTNFSSFD